MLKRLTDWSRTALQRTRKKLGTEPASEGVESHTPPPQDTPAAATPQPPAESARPSRPPRKRRKPNRSGAPAEHRKKEEDAEPQAADKRRGRPPQHGNRPRRPWRKDPDSLPRREGGPRAKEELVVKRHGKAPEARVNADGETHIEPLIIPREDHPLSRQDISRNALKVLNRLHEAGYAAYLVGGGVRDVLVGLSPKDFDVATDASPENIRKLFGNSRIIGRRFQLVHVLFGRDVIEVATFRAAHDKGAGGEVGETGRIVRDNVFGTIEEDALRRDFSVNALYYNIADFSLVDYAGGLKDLERRTFNLIGDPVTRCEEDPVRVLRAVRLAAKLDFGIHELTLDAMQQTAHELGTVAPARLFEEVLKLFQGGYAEASFRGVVDHDLLQFLFPLLAERLATAPPQLRQMLDSALKNTDRRVAEGLPITPAYLLAFMLWPDVEERAAIASSDEELSAHDALVEASDEVISLQLAATSIPRRFTGPMRDIWLLQPRLENYRGGRAARLIENKRFRAAYDFLLLRSGFDEQLKPVANWWTRYQELDAEAQTEALSSKPVVDGSRSSRSKPRSGESENANSVSDGKPTDGASKPRRRRRRGGRKRNGGGRGEQKTQTPTRDKPGQ